MCVFKLLTAAGFGLLIAVDEEVPGALRAEGQQDTLQQSWQQSKTQQKGPQRGIPHDGFYPKDLHNAQTRSLLVQFKTWNNVLIMCLGNYNQTVQTL